MTGNTRMRVRMDFYDTPTPNATSCGTSDFGQVEDYTVNINPCVPTVIINPAPSSVSVTCGGNTTIGFTAVGSFPVYQWQTRSSSTSTWVNVSNNATFSGSTTSALSITNAGPTLNGNQLELCIQVHAHQQIFLMLQHLV